MGLQINNITVDHVTITYEIIPIQKINRKFLNFYCKDTHLTYCMVIVSNNIISFSQTDSTLENIDISFINYFIANLGEYIKFKYKKVNNVNYCVYYFKINQNIILQLI